jgi:hypothetical protein
MVINQTWINRQQSLNRADKNDRPEDGIQEENSYSSLIEQVVRQA